MNKLLDFITPTKTRHQNTWFWKFIAQSIQIIKVKHHQNLNQHEQKKPRLKKHERSQDNTKFPSLVVHWSNRNPWDPQGLQFYNTRQNNKTQPQVKYTKNPQQYVQKWAIRQVGTYHLSINQRVDHMQQWRDENLGTKTKMMKMKTKK